MTLRQFIRDNTDGGHNIARVLIDVMEGRLDGTKINHRLTAARLLTIYGHDDADDFIDYDTYDSPPKVIGDEIWYALDTGLRALIKEKTEDGYVICLLLIDVMDGKIKDATVGHRVSAAKELLNRAFGKAQSRPLPKSTGPIWVRRPITPDDTVALSETREVARRWPVQTDRDAEALTLGNSTPAPATNTAVLEEPEQQPETETEDVARIDTVDPLYIDEEILWFFESCYDDNFDPYEAAVNPDYAQSYTGCPDPECEVHGDPPKTDFDPNDFHY